MGIYSTKEVTREWAIMQIVTKVGYATDRQLESMLFDLIGDDTLNNFQISPATPEET